MNLLEQIKRLRPCSSYGEYLKEGTLTEQTTLRDILHNGFIFETDREWLFSHILGRDYDVAIAGQVVYVFARNRSCKYPREDFLVMIDWVLEQRGIKEEY
mgnify:CR=1 FL=1